MRATAKKRIFFIYNIIRYMKKNVIQTTEGKKNLGNVKWMFSRFFVAPAPLNDNSYKLKIIGVVHATSH